MSTHFVKLQTRSRYSDSKQAQCRVGGDFPYLSVADDVNLYIEVHLRRQVD